MKSREKYLFDKNIVINNKQNQFKEHFYLTLNVL